MSLPKLARSISYRVKSGGVSSRLFKITVLEPPFVQAITASGRATRLYEAPGRDR